MKEYFMGIFYLSRLFYVNHFRITAVTVKLRFGFCRKFHYTRLSCIERIITRTKNAFPRQVFRAALADDDLADAHFLIVIDLDAQPLCSGLSSEFC